MAFKFENTDLESALKEMRKTPEYKKVTLEDALKKIAVRIRDDVDGNKTSKAGSVVKYKNGAVKIVVRYGTKGVYAKTVTGLKNAAEANEAAKAYADLIESGKIDASDKKKIEDAMNNQRKLMEARRKKVTKK